MYVCIIFAVAGDDFTTPDPFSVTFDASLMPSTSACVSIFTVDDNDLEADHNFIVSIDSTTPSITVGTPSSVTATLIDNEGM